MNGHGKKGGTGATAGRKAEVVVLDTPAGRFTKRVFFGQRWMVVLQFEENDAGIVTAFHTEAEAKAQCDHATARGYMVAFYGLGRPA